MSLVVGSLNLAKSGHWVAPASRRFPSFHLREVFFSNLLSSFFYRISFVRRPSPRRLQSTRNSGQSLLWMRCLTNRAGWKKEAINLLSVIQLLEWLVRTPRGSFARPPLQIFDVIEPRVRLVYLSPSENTIGTCSPS